MNLMGTAARAGVVTAPGDAIPGAPSRHGPQKQRIFTSNDRACSGPEHFLLQKTPVNHSGFWGCKYSRRITQPWQVCSQRGKLSGTISAFLKTGRRSFTNVLFLEISAIGKRGQRPAYSGTNGTSGGSQFHRRSSKQACYHLPRTVSQEGPSAPFLCGCLKERRRENNKTTRKGSPGRGLFFPLEKELLV